MRQSGLFGPVLAICLGVVFLLNNFGLHLPLGVLVRSVWPFILIAVGVWQIVRHRTSGFGTRSGTLTGGIVMITVGVLFALQQLADISFRETWPVLLIAIGFAGLLEFRGNNSGFNARWDKGGSGR